jgi:hypothetical protein
MSGRFGIIFAGFGLAYWWIWTPSSVLMISEVTTYKTIFLPMLARVPKALATVKKERARTKAEHDAFEQFASCVASLKAEAPKDRVQAKSSIGDSGAVAATVERTKPTETDTLESVQQRYRETVMAVSHYEGEDDEPLQKNMALEFSPGVAQAVTKQEILRPQLKETLLQQSQQACQTRKRFLRVLENKRESIVTVRRCLRDIHSKVDVIEESLHRDSARELIERWRYLDESETRGEKVLKKRQKHLQKSIHGWDIFELESYLYSNQSWSNPGLNDGVDCICRIHETKRDVVKSLSKWR